jgi:hypothetical protein
MLLRAIILCVACCLHDNARNITCLCHVTLLGDVILQQNVLAIAGVEQVIMTNIPFDDKEASQWIAGKEVLAIRNSLHVPMPNL